VSPTTSPTAFPATLSWGLDRLDQDALPLDGGFDTRDAGGVTGRGVHVYMVDTGVRTTHSEFTGRVGAGMPLSLPG
jgi:subtilisin family serine protease